MMSLIVKYLGPTDTKGARFSVRRTDTGKFVYVGYNHSAFDPSEWAAITGGDRLGVFQDRPAYIADRVEHVGDCKCGRIYIVKGGA